MHWGTFTEKVRHQLSEEDEGPAREEPRGVEVGRLDEASRRSIGDCRKYGHLQPPQLQDEP